MQTFTPNQVYYVRSSSSPTTFYLVAENSRGFLECDCKGSQFRRDRPCKHCKAVASGQVKPATPKGQPVSRTHASASTATRDLVASLDV